MGIKIIMLHCGVFLIRFKTVVIVFLMMRRHQWTVSMVWLVTLSSWSLLDGSDCCCRPRWWTWCCEGGAVCGYGARARGPWLRWSTTKNLVELSLSLISRGKRSWRWPGFHKDVHRLHAEHVKQFVEFAYGHMWHKCWGVMSNHFEPVDCILTGLFVCREWYPADHGCV